MAIKNISETKTYLKLVQWIMNIDVPKIQASIDLLQKEMPTAKKEDLVDVIFLKARRKAIASGIITGIPGSFFTMIPTALSDTAYTLKLEVVETAKVALLYDPTFFDCKDNIWDLFVPILDIQKIRKLAQKEDIELTSDVLITKHLSKHTLKFLQKALFKKFAVKMSKKAIFTRSVPVIGGAIGGTINYFEMKYIHRRVALYFQTLYPL